MCELPHRSGCITKLIISVITLQGGVSLHPRLARHLANCDSSCQCHCQLQRLDNLSRESRPNEHYRTHDSQNCSSVAKTMQKSILADAAGRCVGCGSVEELHTLTTYLVGVCIAPVTQYPSNGCMGCSRIYPEFRVEFNQQSRATISGIFWGCFPELHRFFY